MKTDEINWFECQVMDVHKKIDNILNQTYSLSQDGKDRLRSKVQSLSIIDLEILQLLNDNLPILPDDEID